MISLQTVGMDGVEGYGTHRPRDSMVLQFGQQEAVQQVPETPALQRQATGTAALQTPQTEQCRLDFSCELCIAVQIYIYILTMHLTLYIYPYVCIYTSTHTVPQSQENNAHACM